MLSGVTNGLAKGSCVEPEGRWSDFVLFWRAAEMAAVLTPEFRGFGMFLPVLGLSSRLPRPGRRLGSIPLGASCEMMPGPTDFRGLLSTFILAVGGCSCLVRGLAAAAS